MKKQTWFYLVLLAVLALGAVVTIPARAEAVIYVDTSATGANDGSSWADAYTDLQVAIAASGPGTSIWVAEGTYYPTTGTDRAASFIMRNGVALYGGFPLGGSDLEARDWEAYPTILSGDIGTPENNADNSYHVVIADDTDETAVLDGFIITGGNADGTGIHRYGGGMYISGGSPTLRNIIFDDNWARDGGGMYAANGSSPTLENCRFAANTAQFHGGGMRIVGTDGERHSTSLSDVVFLGNTAGQEGGALSSIYSSGMILNNVTFTSNNVTSGRAGAMRSSFPQDLTLENVEFHNNFAGSDGQGGAMYVTGVGGYSMTNVTFSANHVVASSPDTGGTGGALFSGGGAVFELTDVTFDGNYATNLGRAGAMHIWSGSGTLNNVSFMANQAGTGGAVWLERGTLTVTKSHFEGNTANAGGALYIGGSTFAGTPIASFEKVVFQDNEASWGGGIYSDGSDLTLTGVTFDGNQASYGGGMFSNESDLNLTGVTFSGNQALGGGVGGGGGMMHSDSDLELSQVTFIGNSAGLNGGGAIRSFNCGMDIINVNFLGNQVVDGNGGALYQLGGIIQITNGILENNTAKDGGGVYNTGTLTVLNSTISGNVANGSGAGGGDYNGGGGIYNYQMSGILNVVNSTISGNQAADYGGGILNYSGAQLSLLNVTITDNIANSNEDTEGRAGGLSFISTGTWTVRNSVIAGNTILEGVLPSPDCNISGGVGGTVEYTLMGDNRTCSTHFIHGVNGNIVGTGPDDAIDPLLGRLGDNGGFTQTHALLSGSPARDAGTPADCPAADQRGMLRPRDSAGDGTLRCDMGAFEVGPPNDAWTRAIDVSAGPVDVQEYIDQPGLSRWYKFRVYPGARVNVELEPGNVNLDIALFGDIQAAYDELFASEEESDLPKLSAEFAAAAHSPFAYSPFAYSPFAYSPFAYSPFAYSPFAYSPFAYSPFAYSPFAYSPFAYSPFAYSPFAYSPFAYSPFAYSPFAYSPFAYSPGDYEPELEYTSAQMHTLLAISAQEGTTVERIEVNTWDNRGYFFVRISGRNGAFDLGQPYTLRVIQDLGVCDGLEWIERNGRPSVPTPDPGFAAIFLTDWSRFDATDPQFGTLQSTLSSFAGSVNGIVVNVGQDDFVKDANAAADAAPECLYAKNQVARLIKDYVTAYRDAGHPLEYVVLVGNDNIIPYFRYPDRAEIGRERDYNPPVLVGTSSYASLAFDHFLGQDAYGTDLELSIHNTTLPLPDLAVGRLVETPADILNMLNVYTATLIPESALVTGYCFLADAAEAIADELTIGLGGSVNTLITPQEISPAEREGTPPEDAPWPASLLADNLFSQRHDLIFLAGHFSAQGTLAADYETRLYAYELLASGVDLQNALVYSAGCHSGYNIVNEHGVPYVTLEPDWAQAFAQKGATFIGGTGYQYGDTDFLEYSERLYLEFTRELRCGDGSVGKALVRAKQAYLAGITDMIGIDEKAVQISTLFGLPMFTVEGLDSTGCPQTSPPSIVNSTTGYVSNPGVFLDLQFANVTIYSDLTMEAVELKNVLDPDEFPIEAAQPDLITIYYSGTNGVVTKPAEPILPLERRNVHFNGTVLRGVGFRGGSYTDLPGMIPLTGGATTETRAARTPFQTDVLYPLQPWSVNHFPQLIDSDSGITWLDVKPAQFISDPGDDWTGTWRTYNNVDFRLFYSNHTEALAGGAVPSLASPPAILQVLAASGDGEVHFQVTVAGDPAAGVQEVWVTYTGLPCNSGTCWESLDLVQNSEDSTLWQGTLLHGGATSGELRYMVQAVNGVGLVTLLTNHGEYYQVDVDPADPTAGADPAQPPEATSLTLLSPPTSGAYSIAATFSAELKAGGTPLAGQQLTFALGAQQRTALTGADGIAAVTFPLNAVPGPYQMSVSFTGTTDYQRSSASSAYTINKQATSLVILEDSFIVQLTDGANRAIPHKTVLFVISGDGNVWNVVEITNFLGQAAPGHLALSPGTYSAIAYFGQVVGLVDLTDLYYHGESAAGSLEVLPDPDTEIVSLALPLDPVETGTEVQAAARFAGGQSPHTAVWDWGDGNSCDTSIGGACALTKPFDWVPGEVTGIHTYAEPGMYDGSLTITDGDDNSVVETFIVNVIAAPESAPEILALELPIDPVAIGSEIVGTASFLGSSGPHSAVWDWSDGTTCDTSDPIGDCTLVEPEGDIPGKVTGIHSYTEPGVYTVRLTVTDAQDNFVEAVYEYVVVYDPQGGFVTGGGWIWSQAGWCQLDEACAAAEGRANFGFVSRYRRGANTPTGNTQFNFSAGGFTFLSESYQWLIVNRAGTNAQFKGSGTVNDQAAPGEVPYEFMVWAGDGGRRGEDTFRIRVWYMADGKEVTVYDNGSDQVIGGGSIVIH